jgi:hypothetical protein
MTDIVERLKARTVETLPENWKQGRTCPECNSSAERPKCMWDMGGACPRHDPTNYEPSPYVEEPDKDCTEAAAEITRLRALVEEMGKGFVRIERMANTIQFNGKQRPISHEDHMRAWADIEATAIRAKGGTEHTPTQDAYDAACAALAKTKASLAAVTAERDALREALEYARERIEHWADMASRADCTRYDTSDDLAKLDAAIRNLGERS